MTTFDVFAGQAMADIKARLGKKQSARGLSTGFPDVDHFLGGLQPGHLVLLAARPAMGRLIFLTSIARHLAIRSKTPVCFVVNENFGVFMAEGILCAHAHVERTKARLGKVSSKEVKALENARRQIKHSPLFIDDRSGESIDTLLSSARAMHARNGVRLMIIDSLELISKEIGRDVRPEDTGSIIAELKTLAQELNIPILIGGQVSSVVEGRKCHRPMIKDILLPLKDFDAVMSLYRDSVYDDSEKVDDDNSVEVMVLKSRSGVTGFARLKFISEFLSMENLAFGR
jgi:replicative DNA helicase